MTSALYLSSQSIGLTSIGEAFASVRLFDIGSRLMARDFTASAPSLSKRALNDDSDFFQLFPLKSESPDCNRGLFSSSSNAPSPEGFFKPQESSECETVYSAPATMGAG